MFPAAEMRNVGEFLRYEGNASRKRVARRGETDWLAVNTDGAFVRPRDSGDNQREGRLAHAVFVDDRDRIAASIRKPTSLSTTLLP
jgi:hypothetical protein